MGRGYACMYLGFVEALVVVHVLGARTPAELWQLTVEVTLSTIQMSSFITSQEISSGGGLDWRQLSRRDVL